MAVIQALLSVMTDQGDVIHSIRVGSSALVFLVKGQLYLVAAHICNEGDIVCLPKEPSVEEEEE